MSAQSQSVWLRYRPVMHHFQYRDEALTRAGEALTWVGEPVTRVGEALTWAGLQLICGPGAQRRSLHGSDKLEAIGRHKQEPPVARCRTGSEMGRGADRSVPYVSSFGLPTLVAVYRGRSPMVLGSAFSS